MSQLRIEQFTELKLFAYSVLASALMPLVNNELCVRGRSNKEEAVSTGWCSRSFTLICTKPQLQRLPYLASPGYKIGRSQKESHSKKNASRLN